MHEQEEQPQESNIRINDKGQLDFKEEYTNGWLTGIALAGAGGASAAATVISGFGPAAAAEVGAITATITGYAKEKLEKSVSYSGVEATEHTPVHMSVSNDAVLYSPEDGSYKPLSQQPIADTIPNTLEGARSLMQGFMKDIGVQHIGERSINEIGSDGCTARRSHTHFQNAKVDKENGIV